MLINLTSLKCFSLPPFKIYLAIINSQHGNKDSESRSKFLLGLLSWEQKTKACALELLRIDMQHKAKVLKVPFPKDLYF